jgi:Skp family chaperone for outer membrane proteins
LAFGGGIPAAGDQPSDEVTVGVANVGYLLDHYWRVSPVRAALERQKVSEEYRQKQMEVTQVEQELASQRFWFLPRKTDDKKLQEKQNELDAIARRDAQKVREREKEAIDELSLDIERATEEAAESRGLSFIFDANDPYILFLNIHPKDDDDITEDVMELLNPTELERSQ